MNKIKDFFYDKNDILIALILVALATVVILWRAEAIMDYPSQLVANSYVNENSDGSVTVPPNMLPDNDNSTVSGTVDSDVVQTDNSDDTNSTVSDTPEMYAVYINYGETTAQIAEKIVALGYFDTTDAFLNMVNAMGAETKLQTGNHIMPENATQEEVVKYLMEPGL